MLKTLFNISVILALTGAAIVLSSSPEQPSSEILTFALDRTILDLNTQFTSYEDEQSDIAKHV